MPISFRIFTLFLLVLLPSCGDDGSGLRPTLFQARIVSPAGTEGGALVELVGAVDEVTAPTSDALLVRPEGATTWVFLARQTPGELLFTVRVPEEAGRPGARLLEVVAPDDRLRTDLSAYSVEMEP